MHYTWDKIFKSELSKFLWKTAFTYFTLEYFVPHENPSRKSAAYIPAYEFRRKSGPNDEIIIIKLTYNSHRFQIPAAERNLEVKRYITVVYENVKFVPNVTLEVDPYSWKVNILSI